MLPPSGPILNALARFDPLPSVHGPAANVPAPTRRILASPGVRAARHSVVRVFGTACGLGVEGSGWVVAPGLVVTNAHVVAGETDTQVQIGGVGPGHAASALVFDPHNDIAILRVPGLTAAAAPGGRRADVRDRRGDPRLSARRGLRRRSRGGWARPRPSTPRTPTARATCCAASRALRGEVRPGNSGGPMVNGRGQVVATVFAALTGTPRAGGFAVPNELVRAALRRAEATGGTVTTGHCAN